MKIQHSLLLAALAAPALVAVPRPVETVRFAPAEGLELTKRFVTSGTIELDDMSVLMNGEDPGMTPSMEMETSWTQTIVVTDVYESAADGRPTVLLRTYDEIDQEIEVDLSIPDIGQDESMQGSGSSELEGVTVRFEWDEETDSYRRSFPEGEQADEALLEGLTEDMDLRTLLPDGEVAVGDSWDVDIQALVDVLAPGGNLSLDVEMDGQDMGMGPDPAMMAQLHEILGEMLEGDATATLEEVREVDGSRMAVIRILMDINTARDMTAIVEDLMRGQVPEGMDASIDAVDIEFLYEGRGQLLWNLSKGHLHSFEMSGDVVQNMDMEMSMNMGETVTISTSMEMSGEMTQKVTVE